MQQTSRNIVDLRVSGLLYVLDPQVVTMLIKGDTVDVNVASIQRMTPEAWAAAAEVFKQQLQGVQLLTQEQVCSW